MIKFWWRSGSRIRIRLDVPWRSYAHSASSYGRPAYIADADIIFLSCGFFFFLSIFLFCRLILAVADWMSTIPHMVWPYSANLGCRSEACCTQLAANTGCKNLQNFTICIYHRTNLSGYIFATKARIYRQLEKKLVKQQCLLHKVS